MIWNLLSLTQPQLPPHCEPTSNFLYQWSATFHVCVPTDLALISSLLGTLSIVSWLFAQLPQIYKNYALSSTTGLSIYFLVEWCLGDLSNLLGAVFTDQASWQIIVAGYYCFVDLVLVFQWFWYEHLRHGWTIKSIWIRSRNNDDGERSPSFVEGVDYSYRSFSDADSIRSCTTAAGTPARDIRNPRESPLSPSFRFPNSAPDEKPNSLSSSARRGLYIPSSSSNSLPGPSPRQVLLIACIIALARASPVEPPTIASTAQPSAPILGIGTVLSWSSTALYLLSRLPQLYKNYSRQSTSGLSPHLFMAAFFGNLFYSSSILANPYAWNDYDSYGGGGWAGPEGSVREDWVFRAMPFFLGAAGVLILDAAMGVQFLMYGETNKVVIAEEVDQKRQRRRWKRVSGYMRGWVPSFRGVKVRGINARNETHGQQRTYGTIS